MVVGVESIFCPYLKGRLIYSTLFHFWALRMQRMFDVYTCVFNFIVASSSGSGKEAKFDEGIRAKTEALGTQSD